MQIKGRIPFTLKKYYIFKNYFMSQYIITIQENQAGLSFLEFAKNLNFILNIKPLRTKKQAKEVDEKIIPMPKKNGDFSELFGLWKDSDINLEQIRAKAWKERK